MPRKTCRMPATVDFPLAAARNHSFLPVGAVAGFDSAASSAEPGGALAGFASAAAASAAWPFWFLSLHHRGWSRGARWLVLTRQEDLLTRWAPWLVLRRQELRRQQRRCRSLGPPLLPAEYAGPRRPDRSPTHAQSAAGTTLGHVNGEVFLRTPF